MCFDETGLFFVPPSPNMPTLDTAIVYPGLCLVEGTTLSEGRGTTRPFETVGAPGLDGRALIEVLREEGGAEIEGLTPRAVAFRPMFQKHAGTTCGGIFLHVHDRRRFHAWRFGQRLLHVVARHFPEAFGWRAEAYEFVDRIPAIDLLTGSSAFREVVEAGQPLEPLFDRQAKAEAAFVEARRAFLHDGYAS